MRIKRKPTGTFGTIAPEPIHRRFLPFAAILILVILGAGIFIPGEYGSSNEERLAIGIFAVGVIFLELIERWIIAFALGLALWIGAMLAFIDFVVVVQAGDLALSKRFFQSELSPLAAVITASLGLGLAVLSRRFRRRFQTVLGVTLGFLATVISGVALWGYLNGIVSAYQWSRYPALAAPSALGFLICGLLVVGIGYGSQQENQRPSTRSTAIAVGFSTAVGVLLMIAALFNEDVPVHRPLTREARLVRVALENTIADLVKGVIAIENAASHSNGSNQDDDVRALIMRYPALEVVGFFSKDGLLRIAPAGGPVNHDAWKELLRDADTQKQSVFSRVVRQENEWVIYFAVRSDEKRQIVGGIINVGKILKDATDDLPAEVGIRIRYAGNDLLDRNLPAAGTGSAEYEVSFPLAGRPGWQLALSEKEEHVARPNTATLFKFPVTIFLAGAAIWWGLVSRRRLARAELLVRDIEQSLAEEGPLQERAVIAMEGARDIIVMADPEERLTYINQSGRTLLRAEGIQGLFLGDLLTVGTLAEIRRIGFVTARQSGSWSNVGVIKTPEFGELPVAVRILPHIHPDGKAEGYSFILTYIHHLRGTSTTKVFSSTPVWLLADRLPVPLWAASPEGIVEYANQALLTLLATDLETFRATWPAGYMEAEGEDEEHEDTRAHVPIGKEGKHRLLLRTGEGRPVWIDEEVLSLKRPDAAEKSCILGIITEANREQRAVQQAELLSALEELLSAEGAAAYWVHNVTKDTILYAASATSSVLGINNDELKLRPEAWRGLIPGDVEIPSEPAESFKATYSLHRDDGGDLPVEHCVVPFKSSADGEEFHYAFHLISPVNEGSALVAEGDEIGALRAFRIENEHLYRFLTRYVHDGARQIGTLGRFVAEAVKGSVPAAVQTELQADLIKLGKETERLVGCLQEFSEIARVQRVVTKSEHSTLGDAIGRLQAMRYGLPVGVTFSGDLTFEVRCPPELLDHTVRSIAVFATERSIGGAARDIAFGVHAVPGGTLIRCSLGDMPLSRDELARAFLPGAEITKSGQILPSLAAVSAVARRLDGRAWLSRSTNAGIVLQITMRS